MPIARTFDGTKIVTTLRDGYLDRLSRWSDIREYLPFLYETAASYDGVRVLELGARKGNSTLAFLAAADAVGGHVWSGDIDNIDLNQDGMLPWRENPRWTFICGDDMDTVAEFPAGVDVLFIDTSHEYEHTLAELRAYMPRLVKGGTALFHDTISFPGVWDALDEYCAAESITWENIPGVYGMGVIRA